MTYTQIQWPDGIDEQAFLSQYWQQRPLLIRQAFPDFKTPLPADELAGLSLEADTTGRLITLDTHGNYSLEYGPFQESRFDELTGNDWSLLVTDVEKHLPELRDYLQPFLFLPSWRVDDLMVSYAPVGASVGAHIDEYDVFLLQASGKRRWSINSDPHVCHQLISDSDLKVLKDFQPTDSWELLPGDMLYLPPGIAHHGIASGDECTTWSVGFRAPAIADLVMRIAERVSESMPSDRYRDPPLEPAKAGEITDSAVAKFKQIWEENTVLDDQRIRQLLGQLLTESNSIDAYAAPSTDQPNNTLAEPTRLTDPKDLIDLLDRSELQLAPFSRILWHETDSSDDTVQLFVDTNDYQCSRWLAIQLSSARSHIKLDPSNCTQVDKAVIVSLLQNGSLLAVEHSM